MSKKSISFVKLLLVIMIIFTSFSVILLKANASDDVPSESWEQHVESDFGGGTGTQDDPFLIKNEGQLALLALNVKERKSYADKYFRLENNLDLKAYRWNPIGELKWLQDGTSVNSPFSGQFDGNNKTIHGLIVDERTNKNSAGLFGVVTGHNANLAPTIKDLTIVDALIYQSEETAEVSYAGILSGSMLVNQGKIIEITNVSASGVIKNTITQGSCFNGGMVGDATRVAFKNCEVSNINISGAACSGGFVGGAIDSTFTNCTARGTLDGRGVLGGFAGYITSASIVAPSTSSFTKCVADVDIVSSGKRLGGFAGFAEMEPQITNCVAYGDITSSTTGNPKIGGFIGENTGKIENCYALGKIQSPNADQKPGGFMGVDSGGTTIKCMFNKDINPTLGAIEMVNKEGVNDITLGTTQDNLSRICINILDGHELDTENWKSDGEYHWHECTVCEQKEDNASHTLGEWIIDQQPTSSVVGSKHANCIICGSIAEIQDIPKLPKTDKEKIDEAKPLVESAIKNMTVNNELSAKEILDILNKSVQSIEGASLEWNSESPVIRKSTFNEYGLIEGKIILTVGAESVEVSFTKDIDKLSQANKPTYKVLNGNNSQWIIGSNKELTFRIDANYTDFLKILVNGKELSKSLYRVESGSTVIHLNPEYLKSLKQGKHEIVAVFNEQEVKLYFVIKESETPQTNDNSNFMITVLFLLLSVYTVNLTKCTRKEYN